MPSAKYAFDLSSLRLANGKTAIDFSDPKMVVVGGGRFDSLFQTITPTTAASAASDGTRMAAAGFRRTHFRLRMKIPLRRARIGSCRSQRTRSSASARADE